MSDQIIFPGMEHLFERERVSRPAMALLHRLQGMQDACKWVGPFVRTLCTWFKKKRSTVLRWIAELKRAGYLAVTRRGRTSALFCVKVRPRVETSKAAAPITESSNIISRARCAKTSRKPMRRSLAEWVSAVWDLPRGAVA